MYMLKKIKEFFGHKARGGEAISQDVQAQVDIATEIIGLIDEARKTGQPVTIVFHRGGDRVGVLCRPIGEPIIDWVYQWVSGFRVSKGLELLDESNKLTGKSIDQVDRVWDQVSGKVNNRRQRGGRYRI
jgi:hypothetical protein